MFLGQAALQFGYTIFDFGGRTSQVRLAQAQERKAEATLDATSAALVSRVANAYLRVLTTRGILDAQERQLAALQAEADRTAQLEAQGKAAHVEVLRQRYARKAAVMRRALEHSFPPEVQYHTPGGGLYFWPSLPRGCKTGPRSALFRAALDHEVLYVPGRLCYAADPRRRQPDHEMRLSFGAASEANLRAGIERLGRAVAASQAS